MSADPARMVLDAAPPCSARQRPSGQRPSGQRPSRRLLAVGLGLAVFVATTLAIDRAIPRRLACLSSKLDHHRELEHAYDTLFVGSSQSYRDIVPAAFDAEMEARGLASTSFNLGVPGMRPLEATHVVRSILARRPRALRRVFLEVSAFDCAIPSDQVGSDRAVAWHSARDTWRALVGLADEDRPVGDVVRETARHGHHFALRLLGVGRALPALPWRRGDPRSALTIECVPEVVRAFDGYRAMEDEPAPHFAERSASFRARRGEYLAAVEAMADVARADSSLNPCPKLVLSELDTECRAAGVELTLVLLPYPRREHGLVSAAARGEIPRLVSLSDPSLFPRLLGVDARFDWSHLSAPAAVECSAALAAAYASGVTRGR